MILSMLIILFSQGAGAQDMGTIRNLGGDTNTLEQYYESGYKMDDYRLALVCGFDMSEYHKTQQNNLRLERVGNFCLFLGGLMMASGLPMVLRHETETAKPYLIIGGSCLAVSWTCYFNIEDFRHYRVMN